MVVTQDAQAQEAQAQEAQAQEAQAQEAQAQEASWLPGVSGDHGRSSGPDVFRYAARSEVGHLVLPGPAGLTGRMRLR